MSETSAAASSLPSRLDVGELVRQVSELLGTEQPLAQSVTELCTVLTHALGARSVSIVLDDPEHGNVSIGHRYDLPFGLVGDSDDCSVETVPLQIGQRSIGTMKVTLRSRNRLAPHEARALETCARYIAVGLRNARLVHANEDLERLIEVDALTDVGNRRRFDLTLANEWRRCMRKDEPLSIVMVDVDYFKEFNDRYGHVAGDECLQKIATAISQSTMRASDVVTRYGGEEFAAILPETDLAGAVAVAENIRMAVQRMQIPHTGTSLGNVSVSAGIATVVPAAGEEPALLIEDADLALYRAKTSGRNRIVAGSYISEGAVVERRSAGGGVALPIPLTTFLGRRTEIAQINQLLRATSVVTLAGPGGVGKTRLALEVAASCAAERCVAFADFAPVAAAASVIPALASALGLQDEPGRSTEQTICEHLQRNGGLLILDNCEHVLSECARLVEHVLAAAPSVTIIATSREPLGIRGEGVYRIPSLDVPPKDTVLTARDAMTYDAVHLFVDRVRLVDPAFELNDANARIAANLCRRLDGIPLAIELAAPRMRMMTLEQIEKGLDARFELLSGGARTALPRQKTLHALIRWGYDLLSAEEQRAFAELSVLVGRWTLAAAGAVVRDEIDEREVVDLVTSLVDKSLLIAEPRGGEMRYRWLESTRAFASQCLEASGGFTRAAAAHARYFRDFVAAQLATPQRDDAVAFDAIRREYDNVHAALHWALHPGNDVELGIGFAEILWDFWQGAGYYRDAQRYFEIAASLDADASRQCRFAAFITKALMNVGDARRALEHALPLIERCAAVQDWESLHLARRMAASAYFELNRLDDAREQIKRTLAEPCPGVDERALSLGYLACIEMREGNVDEANRLCDEAAGFDVSQSLRSWTEFYRALARFLAGKTEEAIEHGCAALAYEESVHNTMRSAFTLVTLAWCWIAAEESGKAQVALRRALAEPALSRRSDLYCKCFEAFALLAESRGEPARAALLFGFADAEERRRRCNGASYARISQLVDDAKARARDAIGRAAFDAAFMRGAWLSADGAANEALSV
jgi:diguanylate cyclase (GGDEF)-like protein